MRRGWKQPPGVWPAQLTQEGGWDGMGQDGMGWGWSVCVCVCVSGAVSSLQHERRASVQ